MEERFSKEIETLKNNQTKILEITKTTDQIQKHTHTHTSGSITSCLQRKNEVHAEQKQENDTLKHT